MRSFIMAITLTALALACGCQRPAREDVPSGQSAQNGNPVLILRGFSETWKNACAYFESDPPDDYPSRADSTEFHSPVHNAFASQNPEEGLLVVCSARGTAYVIVTSDGDKETLVRVDSRPGEKSYRHSALRYCDANGVNESKLLEHLARVTQMSQR